MVINTIRELMQGIEWVEIATFMSIVLCDLLSKVSFAFVNKYSSKILFLCLHIHSLIWVYHHTSITISFLLGI